MQEELQLRDWLLQDPSIVVVDEAHNIKNPKSRINKAMCMVKTRCRLALTGYPLQNNMDEYFCMINWVRICWSTFLKLLGPGCTLCCITHISEFRNVATSCVMRLLHGDLLCCVRQHT